MAASGIHQAMPLGNMRGRRSGSTCRPIEVKQQDEDQDRRDDPHALLLAAQDLAAKRMGIVAGKCRPSRRS